MGAAGRLKRRRRAAWLRALGVDRSLAGGLAARLGRCECGRRAAAIGVFWSGGPAWPMVRYRNAMGLCRACAREVDAGVRVVWVGKKTWKESRIHRKMGRGDGIEWHRRPGRPAPLSHPWHPARFPAP